MNNPPKRLAEPCANLPKTTAHGYVANIHKHGIIIRQSFYELSVGRVLQLFDGAPFRPQSARQDVQIRICEHSVHKHIDEKNSLLTFEVGAGSIFGARVMLFSATALTICSDCSDEYSFSPDKKTSSCGCRRDFISNIRLTESRIPSSVNIPSRTAPSMRPKSDIVSGNKQISAPARMFSAGLTRLVMPIIGLTSEMMTPWNPNSSLNSSV